MSNTQTLDSIDPITGRTFREIEVEKVVAELEELIAGL